jgi:transposase-like protein
MMVGPNDDVWNIAERARELSPNERSELLNSLRESWKIASHRRMNLLGRASNTMPGATRSVMEMYRNAYSSDLQTLRVIVQAVGGYDSRPSSIERMNQFLMGTSQP